MITPGDLPGMDDDAARRLIAAARSIAPCIDTLEGDPRTTAVAILKGVAAEIPVPGTGRVRSQSRNGTSITWADYGSAFGKDDRAALRSLCSVAGTAAAGAPVGSFPRSTITHRIWPPEPQP